MLVPIVQLWPSGVISGSGEKLVIQVQFMGQVLVHGPYEDEGEY